MRPRHPVVAALLPTVLLATVGCSDPSPRRDAHPSASPSSERLRASIGRSGPLVLEIADTDAERAVGLMRRSEIPPGTGMIFLYDAPTTARFYMYDVPVPLTAVFLSAGRVVAVIDMPPCPAAAPADCPTYGPEVAFDRVVETAPATLAGKVSVGDRLTVEGGPR